MSPGWWGRRVFVLGGVGSGAGSGGGVVGLVLDVFECCCVSVGFVIWLVLACFRELCTGVLS